MHFRSALGISLQQAMQKNAVDGVGGTIKRLVWMQVLSRKTVVKDANTYFKCAEAAPSQVKVIHIPTADILSNQDVLQKRWDGCLSLPQTQSTHHIEAVEPYTVLSKKFADDILVTQFNFQAGIDSEFVETAVDNAKSAENMFLRKRSRNVYIRPPKEDKSWVTRGDILQILCPPTINNWGHYTFDETLDTE